MMKKPNKDGITKAELFRRLLREGKDRDYILNLYGPTQSNKVTITNAKKSLGLPFHQRKSPNLDNVLRMDSEGFTHVEIGKSIGMKSFRVKELLREHYALIEGVVDIGDIGDALGMSESEVKDALYTGITKARKICNDTGILNVNDIVSRDECYRVVES